MRRRWTHPVVVSTTLVLLGLTGAGADLAAPASAQVGTIQLAAASIIIETNATDKDAGLQVFLDAEGWRQMAVIAPDGRRIIRVANTGSLKTWGLTELFSESSEPGFEEAPFWRFKKRFPEGTYRFEGTTVDGKLLVGRARLTHNIPRGPVISAPADGASVPDAAVLASWEPVTKPAGIKIVGYRAIVTDETGARGNHLEVELPRVQTSFTIPSEFLRSGHEYKLEVQAIEKSGNQTLTEITFTVT